MSRLSLVLMMLVSVVWGSIVGLACSAGYKSGFGDGQKAGLQNQWWWQQIKTADGQLRYEPLDKPVTRPTTAE